MRVRIRFFASLRERAGFTEAERTVAPATTVGTLWRELCSEHRKLADFGGRIAFAINQEYVDSETALQDNDEVAFIPPVSGGSSPLGRHV
jgi:molybdopterin converting factor subunit 1